jgi:exopolyphosphatase / guanosine-5'-triphosphate,3'-diphosphate pyrophosphatase
VGELAVKVAVIDIGYNSLKMVKYSIEPDGSSRAYGQLGVMARLGEGLEKTGSLGKEQMARTLEALKVCKESATLDSVKQILLVGTSPVREATNGDEFVRRVQEETGLKMRVLSGNEEALYCFLGASRSIGVPNGLFFDLGGGSLELIYSVNYRIRKILSLPIGALKLTSAFAGKDGSYSRKSRSRMAKRISQILPTRRELEADDQTVLVGTGGTVRALARLDQEEIGYPLNKLHNYTMDYESVQAMSRELLRLKQKDLNKIDAIGEERSESVAAGGLVVRLLMKRFGFNRMTVSTHGLRDGVLTEFFARGMRPSMWSAQREEIERFASPVEAPVGTEGVVELVRCLSRNGIVTPRQEWILVSAMKRGRSPGRADADSDALFGMLMSEDPPMSHEDQLFMSISLVRARRSRTASWLAWRYQSVLSRSDLKSIKMMGACLRLMEIIDKSAAVFRVSYQGGVRITVKDNDGTFPLELVSLAAQGLSSAIRRPVSVFVSPKHGEEQTEELRAGG